MKLVAIAALIAVCGAAKLDRTYLPPSSAATAGGSSDSLQTPLSRSSSEKVGSSGNLIVPTGSYTNDFQGIVVDAAAAGTRSSSDDDQSGLGGPRESYGSTNSKVGDAAFRGSIAGFRNTPTFGPGLNGQASGINVEQNFGGFETKSERPQAFKDRNSNIISYANDVSSDNYSYGFESDNGITIGENGVSNNGIQAQGGYSYKGDDGQIYKVTYVADEGGYRPQGAHLPTPPPIPKEILESLEQNAKDEAAGLVDDGSYDAQKYNVEGDYTHYNGGNIQYNGAQSSQFAKRPESDATSSSTFINQNSQAFGKPEHLGVTGTQSTLANINGQTNQFNENKPNVNELIGFDKQSNQILSGHQQSSSSFHNSGHAIQSSNSPSTSFSQTQSDLGSQGPLLGVQNGEQASTTQVHTQISQFGSQAYPQGSAFQIGGQPSQIGSQINREESASQLGAQHSKPSLEHGFSSTFNSQSNKVNQFGNQASNFQGTFNSPIPTGASNDNRFPSTQFGAEYLPPFKPNNRPSYNRPQMNGFSSVQDSNKDDHPQDFVPLQGQTQAVPQSSSASAYASVGSAGFEPQPLKPLNGFESQFSRPNQFINNNNQVTSQKETESSIIPTSIPETELTTPLEPNEKPAFSQSTQFSSQSTPNFGNFVFQATNNQAPGLQNTALLTQQSTDQALSPSFSDTRKSSNAVKPQFIQNSFTKNQQNGYYSTQKPASFSQGPDDSYYYNQPSKQFGTPTARPEPSRFPSSPSYQSSGSSSLQNNQFTNQQSSPPTPISPTFAPVAPTSPSQYAQSPGNPATNYYNGITQAAISSFPSVSPTSSSHFDSTPTGSQQQSSIPSFPTKPLTTFGKNPSTTFNQNQIQFGQSSPNNNRQPSLIQSFPSKPISSFGQTTATTQIQSAQSSSHNNNEQSSSSEISQEQLNTSNQEYQGTIYEYNKPPEVLPPPEQSDSTSSQSSQTDASLSPKNDQKSNQDSKPQFGSQQTQLGQTSSTTQSQIFSANQGAQNFKPFGSSQSSSTQFEQNSQPSFTQLQQSTQGSQVSVQPVIPKETALFATSQFSQNHQTGIGSGSQYGSQPAIPFDTASRPSKFGQNPHQSRDAGHSSGFTSSQTQGPQPLKPIGSAQPSITQFGQSSFTGLESQTLQQSSQPQLNAQTDKAFGSAPQNSQIQMQGPQISGFASTQQNSQSSQIAVQPFKPFASFVSNQGAKPGASLGFQGYPSSKPPTGTQLTHTQFTQTSQQTFGATQISSQPARRPLADSPTKLTANVPSNNVSPDSLKPQFGQNTQFNQGNQQPFGSAFGQNTFQGTQFASTTSKPQFGTLTQFEQNQNIPSVQPFNSASSQAQLSQGSAQASSSAVTQQHLQSVQGYKPLSASSSQGSRFQNKPQFDQAPQSSGAVGAQSQFGAQSFQPLSSSNPQRKPDDNQNIPLSSQQGSPCCQGSKDSAIAPLNVGKPSQAFAQTQSQFTGFQGAQGFHSQSVAGRGEEFGGPRQPPSFDAQTGYHY